MRNSGWAAAALIGTALAVTACGPSSYSAGSSGPAAPMAPQPGAAVPPLPAPPPTLALKVTRTSAGTVLASSRGLTLYYYTEDKPGSGRSACTGSCASAWPPLAAPVRAPAGVHLPGPLGMIHRPGGGAQVTVNGYPIYLYIGDKAPGQAAGNGVGGVWHVIKIRSTAASQASALKVVRTSAGPVLASSRGLTLYYFARTSRAAAGRRVPAAARKPGRRWPPRSGPRRACACPARSGDHPAWRAQAGHHQRLPRLPLRRGQGPGQAAGNGIGGVWRVIKIA